MNLPQQFWEKWQEHARQLAAVYDQVCALHLAVARRSAHTDAEKTLDEHEAKAPRPTRVFTKCFDTGDWAGQLPFGMTAEYGHGLSHRIAHWWYRRTTVDNVGEIRWITLANLYADDLLGLPRSNQAWTAVA